MTLLILALLSAPASAEPDPATRVTVHLGAAPRDLQSWVDARLDDLTPCLDPSSERRPELAFLAIGGRPILVEVRPLGQWLEQAPCITSMVKGWEVPIESPLALSVRYGTGGSEAPQTLADFEANSLSLRGWSELQSGRPAQAEATFTELQQARPERIDATLGRARALLALDRHPEAIELACSALRARDLPAPLAAELRAILTKDGCPRVHP